jgi:phosphonatase-like hydrolase
MPSPSFQLAIFDIAGTTVKDNGEIAQCFQKAFLEKSYRIPIEEIQPLMGYKKTEAIQLLLNQYERNTENIQPSLINAIHERFVYFMINYYSELPYIELLPHAEEILETLKANNIKAALNTGFSRNITQVIVDKLKWLQNGLVQAVVCSDEVPAGRPQPFMIEKIMQQLQIALPSQVVKIGDTEVDIREGQNAGCLYSIAVTTGAYSREQLMPFHPDFIFDDLIELKNLI